MLHLHPTLLTLWLGIGALVVVAILCVISWRRSPHKLRTALLELLRFSISLCVVFLLWQAEWRTIIHPNTKPKIAILWDDSASMQSLDAKLPAELSENQNTSNIVSRAQWVEKALSSELWTPLRSGEENELITQAFASPRKNEIPGSDLAAPLEKLLEKESNLRAVIMLSDGDANLGEAPVSAAQKYRLRGVPIFTIPVGSESRLPDLDLLSVTAPTYGILGENVQIPFTIRSSLPRQVRSTVRLRDELGRERSKNIVLAPNSETHDSILWKLEKEGASTLTLSFPVADGELVAANNSQKFSISARPERIRVLIVETLPRWEYRFLRNSLSRDPGVELSCLLLHPELGPGGGGNYIQKFPESLEALSKYDVVVIGDVGVGENQLSKEQCALIRGLVENQASGVVFLPGRLGNQVSLRDTELSDLMPVILDENHKQGFPETLATPLQLTTEGRSSLLTMLGESEEENPEIWRRLPGFYWHAAVLRAKAGTEVLAVHANRRGSNGAVPLMVTKSAGSGKVLFMGIDSAWRWRRGVEDLYHYRFWGQVARWMSYQRNMANGQRVRLFHTPERPQPGTSITLQANGFDPNGAPIKQGGIAVDITAPDGKTQRIELEKIKSEWGAFSGHFKANTPGEWKLRASTSEASEFPTETSIVVQGADIEKIGQPARPDILDEISKISRARRILPEQLSSLINEIKALPVPNSLEKRIALWSHWATISCVIFLLAIFWIGRKLNGTF